MATIVQFESKTERKTKETTKIREEMLEMLDETRKRVEAGEIHGMALLSFDTDGTSEAFIQDGDLTSFDLVGALELFLTSMKMQMVLDNLDD